ncbi:MAG TPA: Arc family DNA-binding protein [Candidatus Sulfotelmatobacter sp.]|nr:Arc family DNA-binding protein [Candidatus Sulfotelmatobacter sp.]
MPTLYVENVPDAVYKALRERARKNRRSMAAEIIEMLERNIPTADELRSRREFARKMREFASREPLGPGPFPSTEEMLREDRER